MEPSISVAAAAALTPGTNAMELLHGVPNHEACVVTDGVDRALAAVEVRCAHRASVARWEGSL
jgi:hypothetical protein